MSSRPECPQCGERWCSGGSSGDGCTVSATPRTPKFYLCFIDFETTGLDPARHEPIEVAAVVTDDRLNELGRFESLINTEQITSDWDEPAFAMHQKSGLLDLVLASRNHRDDVSAVLAAFIGANVPSFAPLHLAGNSVHFDRGFLRAYFPAIEQRFHHRHLDVSSLRTAADIFVPDAAPFGGEKPHRAMADNLRCIQELHHWRAALRGP